MTIAGLSGVDRSDAGIASGLINTSRQIGGAVGLATVSTIAAAYRAHGTITAAVAASDLTHGFRVAFDVLIGLTAAGSGRDGVLHRAPSRAREAEVEPVAVNSNELIEEAA